MTIKSITENHEVGGEFDLKVYKRATGIKVVIRKGGHVFKEEFIHTSKTYIHLAQ